MEYVRLTLWVGLICGMAACAQQRRPTQPVLNTAGTTPPTCGGGAGTPPASMNGPALQLARMINSHRGSISYSAATLAQLPADPIITGVAQWHAEDMAREGDISFVGSDGEDPFRRVRCSGGPPNIFIQALAIGYSTDVDAVFDALLHDYYAFGFLFAPVPTPNTSMSIGYSGGYWMILMR